MSCGSTPGIEIVTPRGLSAKWTRRVDAGHIPSRTNNLCGGPNTPRTTG